MKRLPLLSLCLVFTLGVACSNPSQESAPAPTQQLQVKKRTQALGAVTLVEVPVSHAVLEAAGENARVRAFEIQAADDTYSVEDVAQAALQQGVSDPVSLPWQVGQSRDRDETRSALRYLNAVVPAIEADVGTDEAYRSGYYHWFRSNTAESCDLGDAYFLIFKELGTAKAFVIETQGVTEC
jgi:hypothetical protein